METIYLQDNFHPIVKLEPLQQDTDTEWENDVKPTIERIKMGEIFQTRRNHLTFVCTHCAAEFPLFIQFTSHIEQHLQKIGWDKIETAIAPKTYPIDGNSDEIDIKPTLLDSTKTLLDAETTHWNEMNSSESDTDAESYKIVVEKRLSKIIGESSQGHETNSRVDCPKCSRNFKNAAGLKVHLARSHANKQFQCSLCKKIFWSLTTFKLHVKNCVSNENQTLASKQPDEQGRCNQEEHFDEEPKNESVVSDDLQTNNPERHQNTESVEYECFQCHQSFTTYIECKTHVHNHLSNNTNCIYCSRTIKTYSSQLRHRRYCKLKPSDNTPTECFMCGKLFPSRGRYFIHAFEDHHLNVDQINKQHKSKCRHCSLEFYSRIEYEKHRKWHTAEIRKKHHKCNECGKVYKNWHIYRIHVRGHAGEALFSCDICNKTYPISYKFDHARKHSEKKFQCSICGVMFANPYRLKRHLMIHTDERPYECEYCHIKYRTKHLLDGHRRTHTGDFIHYCKPCEKGYVCSKGLRKHNLKIHGLGK